MTEIKISYVVGGNPELEDKELPATLSNALGMTFPEFVGTTLRCFKTEKRMQGWWFRKLSPDPGENSVPDVVVGFCGDIVDLEITLIHELLHLFRWDEKMVEAKAREIQEAR